MLLAEYLRLKSYPFCHINNEVYTKSWRQKHKIQAMGSAKGFPDYLVIVNGRLIAIEMKRLRGGRTSPEQQQWIDRLNAIDVPARVCNGFLEAKDFINEYN